MPVAAPRSHDANLPLSQHGPRCLSPHADGPIDHQGFRRHPRRRRRVVHHRGGHDHGPHRAERGRKDDPLQLRGRPLSSDRGVPRPRWRAGRRARAGPHLRQGSGPHLPDPPAVSGNDRARERHGGAARAAGRTVLDQLADAGSRRRGGARRSPRPRHWIDFMGLSHLADRPARILSGGQRKLLELARVPWRSRA